MPELFASIVFMTFLMFVVFYIALTWWLHGIRTDIALQLHKMMRDRETLLQIKRDLDALTQNMNRSDFR